MHPYIRRRNGTEPVTYLHPLLEPVLAKTLGVPLFQEQLMQMAITIAGFTPGEADQLRQAMASKRSKERMERIRQRLYDGMAERGVVGETADAMWDKLAAFANYGFPESHSVSFAYLVYASSWLKRYYPAAFCAALLNAQPMGFYSPHSLVQDARRHGVEVRTPDLNASDWNATLEPPRVHQHTRPSDGAFVEFGWQRGGTGAGGAARHRVGAGDRRRPRQGDRRGRPYESMEDLERRVPSLNLAHLEALATAGAFPVRFRTSSGARRCGERARWRSRGPTGSPASSPASTRRRCRACRCAKRRSPTCGPPA